MKWVLLCTLSFTYSESYPIHVTRSPGSLLWVPPRGERRHHDLEVHVSGSGVLHHDVGEGDGAAALALPHPPQTEHPATHVVVILGKKEREIKCLSFI